MWHSQLLMFFPPHQNVLFCDFFFTTVDSIMKSCWVTSLKGLVFVNPFAWGGARRSSWNTLIYYVQCLCKYPYIFFKIIENSHAYKICPLQVNVCISIFIFSWSFKIDHMESLHYLIQIELKFSTFTHNSIHNIYWYRL